jgi:hypothetical protein
MGDWVGPKLIGEFQPNQLCEILEVQGLTLIRSHANHGEMLLIAKKYGVLNLILMMTLNMKKILIQGIV